MKKIFFLSREVQAGETGELKRKLSFSVVELSEELTTLKLNLCEVEGEGPTRTLVLKGFPDIKDPALNKRIKYIKRSLELYLTKITKEYKKKFTDKQFKQFLEKIADKIERLVFTEPCCFSTGVDFCMFVVSKTFEELNELMVKEYVDELTLVATDEFKSALIVLTKILKRQQKCENLKDVALLEFVEKLNYETFCLLYF